MQQVLNTFFGLTTHMDFSFENNPLGDYKGLYALDYESRCQRDELQSLLGIIFDLTGIFTI